MATSTLGPISVSRKLSQACQNADKESVLESLEHGADPNSEEAKDLNGKTPLHYVCQYGWLDVIELLIEKYKCNPEGRLTVSKPTWSGKTGTEYSQATPLHFACEHGQVEVAKLLIDKYQCNPNVQDSFQCTPLHYACASGNIDVVKLLIQNYHCNPNAQDCFKLTPLHYAAGLNGNSEVVQFLIPLCVDSELNDVDKDGRTPLYYACGNTHCTDMVKHLIAAGADPNIAGVDGNTPLHIACFTGQREAVKDLLQVDQCDPHIQNVDGLTPLQVNVSSRWHVNFDSEITKELLSHGSKPDVIDNDGNTLLHMTCSTRQLDAVRMLLKANLNPNLQNKDGRTPLQFVASSHRQCFDFDIMKELISHGADPNVAGRNGNTPLHFVCSIRRLDAMKYLLTKTKCDPNIQNKDGRTPIMTNLYVKNMTSQSQSFEITKELTAHGAKPTIADSCGDTPLHIASLNGDLNTVRHLLSLKMCDPNASNNQGQAPLHVASSLLVMKELVVHGANPNVSDSNGDTPLHIACRFAETKLETVKYLMSIENCDPNVKNNDGLTPLQLTSPTCLNVIKELIVHGANPDVTDSDGNTPLHAACQAGELGSVKCLLNTEKCDTNARNKAGLTALQVTSSYHSLIVDELITHGANPNVADREGNTPLHTACRRYCIDTVKLLTAADSDPNTKNKNGLTPLQVVMVPARNSTCTVAIIRELIRHGAHADDLYKIHGQILKQPLNPPVKVFVVGNPKAGKSTLTAALQKESSFFGRVFTPKQKITGQDERTAGIVPHEYESKEYGYVTFYDFAGQREFYGSHAAVLKNAIRSFPPIFLVVVDLCETEEKIVTSILYWLTFLENQCVSVISKPHVIIVGSHSDVLKERGENPSSKIKSLKANDHIQSVSKFIFAGFIRMNCQYPESRGMTELRQCLKSSCNTLRMREAITFSAHCFYVYLLDKFNGVFAATVEQIQAKITKELEESPLTDTISIFIPDSTLHLCKICDELNDRGHILFLRDFYNIEQSWVVIDKKYLLEQVSGSIFAPEHFKQHTVITQCTCSTGVVPLSSIAKSFPEHNPELLIKYLSCLEFCHEISDPEILHHITAEHTICVVNGPHAHVSNERYFLFPALVSLTVPTNVWTNNSDIGCHFGWMLSCTNERSEQFFSSRFLQVLILRIAFSFALFEGHTCSNCSHPAFKRNCSIWKSGIFWGNDRGVETLVEVLPDNKAVVVLMRCGEEAIADLVHLRSQIIGQVLKAAEEICSSITTSESFIDPSQCRQYPLEPILKLKRFSMLNTSRSVLRRDPRSSVVVPTGTILLRKLIQHEPYAELGEDILVELFENQEPEIISDSVLSQIAKTKTQDFDLFLKIFSSGFEAHDSTSTSHNILPLLRIWRAESGGTYKSLREKLDEFSVFAGRNPLTLAGRQRSRSSLALLKHPSRQNRLVPSINEIPDKGKKPTLKSLQVLKNSKKQVKVIESAAAEWEQLAIALGFGPPVINSLRRDFSNDSKGAVTEVLTKWLNEESELELPITWETLIQCLEDAEQAGLSEELTKLLP